MASYEAGTVIADKYVLSRLLGEGGMGKVYSARNIELDQEVAIKILHADVSALPDYVTRFKREAKVCASLRSEHVARVYDVGTTDQGVPYMVMELLQGEDLEAVLGREKKLPAATAVSYLLQACEGVAEAHRTRLVHRDLKPANLFLAEVPGHGIVLKVVDFGIVKQLGEAEVDALTKTTAMMGTVLYMAPEQLRRRKDVDERVDIWALGVVLYELVTGKVPFNGDTMPEVVAKVLEHQYEAPCDAASDLPEGLSEVIEIALARDPADRYLTVTDFAQALAPFGSNASRSRQQVARISSLVPPSGAPRRSEIRALRHPRRRSQVPVLAAIAVLFAGAFVAVFFGLRAERPAPTRVDTSETALAEAALLVPAATAPSALPVPVTPANDAAATSTGTPVTAQAPGARATSTATANKSPTATAVPAAEAVNPLKKMRIK